MVAELKLATPPSSTENWPLRWSSTPPGLVQFDPAPVIVTVEVVVFPASAPIPLRRPDCTVPPSLIVLFDTDAAAVPLPVVPPARPPQTGQATCREQGGL